MVGIIPDRVVGIIPRIFFVLNSSLMQFWCVMAFQIEHSHEHQPIIVHCFVNRPIMPWRNIAWTNNPQNKINLKHSIQLTEARVSSWIRKQAYQHCAVSLAVQQHLLPYKTLIEQDRVTGGTVNLRVWQMALIGRRLRHVHTFSPSKYVPLNVNESFPRIKRKPNTTAKVFNP